MQKLHKRQEISSKKTFLFVFRDLQAASWYIRGFLEFPFWGFRLQKYKKNFLLRKYKKFCRGFRFLNYKKFSGGGLKSSTSWNIRSFFRASISWNVRNFFRGSVSWIFFAILELRSSISWNIRNFFRGGFFYFFELGPKIARSFSEKL